MDFEKGNGEKPSNGEENKNKDKKTQLYNSDLQESKTSGNITEGLSPEQVRKVKESVKVLEKKEAKKEIKNGESLLSPEEINELANELKGVLTQEKVVTRVYDSSERKAKIEEGEEEENKVEKEDVRPLSKDIEYLKHFKSQEEAIPILKNFNIGQTIKSAESLNELNSKLDDYFESRHKRLSEYNDFTIENVRNNEELSVISNNILQEKKAFENVFKDLLPKLKSVRNKAIKKAKSLELLFNKLKNVSSKDSDDDVKKDAIRILQNTNVTLYYDTSNIINTYKRERIMFEHQANRISDLSFEEDKEKWQDNQELFQEVMGQGESANKLLKTSRVLKMLKLHYGELNNTILEKLQNKDEIETMKSDDLALEEILDVIKDYDLDELYSAVTDIDYGEYHKVYDAEHTNNTSRVRKVDKERLLLLQDFANNL